MATKKLYTTEDSEKRRKKAQEAVDSVLTDEKKEKLDQQYQSLMSSNETRAAIYFASGKNDLGLKTLIDYINETKGKVGLTVWYMLLDGYEITNNPRQHEKLSSYFIKRFKISPPPFHEYQKSNASLQGRNVLKMDTNPSDLSDAKKRDFFNAAQRNKSAKIDFLNIKLTHDDQGLKNVKKIIEIMQFLRKNNIQSTLMGDMNVNEKLEEIIEKNKDDPEAIQDNDSYFWDLYLEIMQWHNNRDNFENVAMDYALLFEKSAQSFQPNQKVESKEGDSQDVVIPDNEILNGHELIQKAQEKLNLQNEVTIDFSNVTRITVEASEELKEFVKQKKQENKTIIIKSPNQIILTIFDMIELTQFLRTISKTR